MNRSKAAAFDLGLIQAPFKDRAALACKACNKCGLDEQYPNHECEYRVLESLEQLDPWANRASKTAGRVDKELVAS